MKYARIQASYLRDLAKKYELSGADLLEDIDAVVRDCNGIGSDSMPDRVVKLATKLNSVMEVPAAIHDRRYMLNVDRLAADTEFLTNVLKIVEEEYAWYNPMRYIMRNRAARYYGYLRDFGGKAWEAAKKKTFLEGRK